MILYVPEISLIRVHLNGKRFNGQSKQHDSRKEINVF
jgi:hypothetical protein